MSATRKLSLTCPDCGSEIVVDAATGAVLTHKKRKEPLAGGHDFDKLLEDQGFRTGLIKAMQDNGIRGLIGALGLDIQLPGDFELEDPEPPVQPGKPAAGGDEDDDAAAA